MQAAGASVVPAVAMLIPIRYFPPERRGGAISMTAAGLALSTAIGPVVAALLLADVYGLDSEWIGFALVPAAVASSALSRIGGKLADRRGDVSLYTLASELLMLCFAMLAAFSGAAPLWTIPLILIFGNVGQTFIQVAISNSLSKTLSKDQAGVGMGLLAFFRMRFRPGRLTEPQLSAKGR
nr:MFS transporter [Cohnella terricola]